MSFQHYASFKGAKQGQFKGETKNPRRKDKWVDVISFDFPVVSPRDASSGQASGKRQHSPIKITKEWGSASPQLFNACVNNESLLEVIIEEVGDPSPGAGEKVVRRITLTNARISERGPHFGPAARGGRSLTEYDITFQKIDVESPPHPMATDSWKG